MIKQIIDTHAHIDQLADIQGALQRAKQAGVSDIVAVSVDLNSMGKILDLAKSVQEPNPSTSLRVSPECNRRTKIHPALGIHPGMVKEGEPAEAFDFIRSHIKEAVAIGETGLDYWYKWVRDNTEERAKQKDALAKHLQLAKEFHLPIIIHSRGAWRDCLSMAQEAGVAKALFHWYSGPVDIMKGILDSGFYVSTSPSVAYSPQSQQAMLAANVERILIETDSPVSYKDDHGGFTSEPKDVWRTLQALSRLKNIDEEKLLDMVNHNAREFFGL